MKRFTHPIDEIIVHCTATRLSQPVTVNDLRVCHRQRGFDDIGYHYVVMPDGHIETGRPADYVGAHCLGHNSRSIGVAYVGGLDEKRRPADTRTPQQREALERLLRELVATHRGARVYGHRDFAAKACPWFDAAAEYSHLSNGQS